MRMSTAGFTGRTDLSGAVLGGTETSRRETAVDFGRYLPLFWLQPHVRDMQLDQLTVDHQIFWTECCDHRKELVKTAGFFPSFSSFQFHDGMTGWRQERSTTTKGNRQSIYILDYLRHKNRTRFSLVVIFRLHPKHRWQSGPVVQDFIKMIEADKEQWKRSCEFLCSASTSSTSTVVLIVLQHNCLWWF